MSFPPFPPNGRYSPSNAYNETSSYSSASAYRPNAPYAPFDAYNPTSGNTSDGRAPYAAYDQPRRPYETDTYDPYRPSDSSNGNAYDPGAPQMRLPPAPPVAMPNMPNFPPRAPIGIQPTLGVRPPPRAMPGAGHLTLLTEPTTVHLAGLDIPIHSLPPSHLPITKYIATNRTDAIEIHRRLCMTSTSIWYADGSSRAGEGWCAAVEWLIDSARSGSKMRECLGNADGLDVELGGLFKAAEGFHEALRQAIKDGKNHSQELIVFCDSQAAIVGIDTSSRPMAIKFDRVWREICSEFLQAELKIAWLPKGLEIEGHILADKIATVGASNSYLKRRKDNTLPDLFMRPGGGEPMPPGSTEAGPWQRGDSDPSRRKTPYTRPQPLPAAPPTPPASRAPMSDLGLRLHTGPLAPGSSPSQNGPPAAAHVHTPTLVHPIPPKPVVAEAPEEETGQPREGSIFVTHFPDEASAKDIGILFGQFGNIVAVDIYHIAQGLPRFAFVAYTDNASGQAAIDDLHQSTINMSSDFARQNWSDLDVWRSWDGRLTVVRSEPGRLVPSSVMSDFPDVPEWAIGGRKDDSPSRKRDRTPNPHSPNKKSRQAAQPINVKVEPSQPSQPPTTADTLPDPLRDLALMPPFPPHSVSPNNTRPAVLPPTPLTADPDHLAVGTAAATAAAPALTAPTNGASGTSTNGAASNAALTNGTPKRPLTNSASEPQEYPIKVGAKTIRAQIDLVKRHFGKVHVSNWIAHSCFIASEIDQARRALQDDLYATDTGFLAGRDLEKTLAARGFTPARVDAFITKVLKVLDGIALAEAEEGAEGAGQEEVGAVEVELKEVLAVYPDQTKEAVDSAARLMEYLLRGKEAQEKKRLEVERRVKVLEGMVKIGEVVGGVVRYLLSDEK